MRASHERQACLYVQLTSSGQVVPFAQGVLIGVEGNVHVWKARLPVSFSKVDSSACMRIHMYTFICVYVYMYIYVLYSSNVFFLIALRFFACVVLWQNWAGALTL